MNEQELRIELIHIASFEHKWELRTILNGELRCVTVHEDHLYDSIFQHNNVLDMMSINTYSRATEGYDYYRKVIVSELFRKNKKVQEVTLGSDPILGDYLSNQILLGLDDYEKTYKNDLKN